MGLFKDIYCSECGTKTKMLLRTKLSDNSYLCSKCMSIVQPHMLTGISNYTINDFHNYKSYVEYSNEQLKPLFHETKSYKRIHIDGENGIFCLESPIDPNTVYYKFHNIDKFDMVFVPEEFKEGFLEDKVSGKVAFEIKMKEPYFCFEEVLDSYAKAKAKKKLLGSKIEYSNPEQMDDFLFYFSRAWEQDIERLINNTDGEEEEEYIDENNS